MALSLAKNQTISLEKTTGNGLTKIRMGLGWDPAQKPKPSGGFFSRLLGGGADSDDIDLDASCIMHHDGWQQVSNRRCYVLTA